MSAVYMYLLTTIKKLKKGLSFSFSLLLALASIIPTSVLADETCLSPLGLNVDETSQILALLNSLTGVNVDSLVSDAFTVPVGNTDSH